MKAEQTARALRRIARADTRTRENELELMMWLDRADTETNEEIERLERI